MQLDKELTPSEGSDRADVDENVSINSARSGTEDNESVAGNGATEPTQFPLELQQLIPPKPVRRM